MSLEKEAQELLTALQSQDMWWCEYFQSSYKFTTKIRKSPLPIKFYEGVVQKNNDPPADLEYRVYFKNQYNAVYLALHGAAIIYEGIVPEDGSLVFKFMEPNDIIFVKPKDKLFKPFGVGLS